MARIKYSSIISQVSGSIGSATFQKGAYGDILRNKPRPRRSGTMSQIGRRQFMYQIHQSWKNLTSIQRSAWDMFISYSSARIRRDKNILQSGHSLFIQYNFMRLIAGYAIMEDPVYIPIRLIFTDLAFGRKIDNTLWVQADLGDVGADIFFSLRISSPRPASQRFNSKGLKTLDIQAAVGTDFDITALYTAAFGVIPEIGDTIHYLVRSYSILSPILNGPISGTFVVEAY